MSGWLIPFAASLVLLGGITAERLSLQPTRSAVAYHQRVKAAADQVPLRFGPWIGRDEPITADARRLLHPNVVINRTYRNVSTGLEVGFLFVQCDDARSIMDHYPPICYVTQGYDKDGVKAIDWKVGGMAISGTEYEFGRREIGQERSIVVDNFIVMPDGRIERDMEAKVAQKDTKLVLYCAGGYRSALAADSLMKMGYSNVFSLAGGMGAYKSAGLPIEKPEK